MSDGEPNQVTVFLEQEFTPPDPLSDYDIQMIHAGLLIPNAQAILSMSREIRKWRGEPNPDLI
jgi:hypothetical protein